MRKLEIRAQGRTIRGHLLGREGLVVEPSGFQGWLGLPAGRRESLARAVEHGEHDVPVFLPSRVITVDGYAVADSEQSLGHLIDNLSGVGATGDRFRLTVDMHGDVKYADVRRVSCVTDDPGFRGGSFIADFQLQLVAADPRKYGETRVLPESGTATSIQVFQYGNFPAFPVVEIPSAPSSYTISAGGKTFTVAGATSGGTHTVDMRTGRVYRNGVEMPGVGSGPLWAVPVGASWTHTLSVAGRVRIIDTYI